MTTKLNNIEVRGQARLLGNQVVGVRDCTEDVIEVLHSDYLLLLHAAGTNIRLPRQPGDGRVLVVKDATGAASGTPHSIDPHGSTQVDGQPSLAISTDWEAAILAWSEDDDQWLLLSSGSGGSGGADGDDGYSVLVEKRDATAGECPSGGTHLTFGWDTTGDGNIDSIQQTAVVCNGLGGQIPVSGYGTASNTGWAVIGRARFTDSDYGSGPSMTLVAEAEVSADTVPGEIALFDVTAGASTQVGATQDVTSDSPTEASISIPASSSPDSDRVLELRARVNGGAVDDRCIVWASYISIR